MKNEVEYFPMEKDVIHRVQRTIANAEVMTSGILGELIRRLGPDDTFDKTQYRRVVVNAYVMNWWHFIGQWEWPLITLSRQSIDRLINKMIDEQFGDLDPMDLLYKDHNLIFHRPGPNSDVAEYMVELMPKRGKRSLWPELYHANGWRDAKDILESMNLTEDDVRMSFAYKLNGEG